MNVKCNEVNVTNELALKMQCQLQKNRNFEEFCALSHYTIPTSGSSFIVLSQISALFMKNWQCQRFHSKLNFQIVRITLSNNKYRKCCNYQTRLWSINVQILPKFT